MTHGVMYTGWFDRAWGTYWATTLRFGTWVAKRQPVMRMRGLYAKQWIENRNVNPAHRRSFQRALWHMTGSIIQLRVATTITKALTWLIDALTWLIPMLVMVYNITLFTT